MRLRHRLLRTLLRPLFDYLALLDRFPGGMHPLDLAWLLAGFLAGWWLYVPLHELAHAAGCICSGCTVERLELAPQYAAAWLARWFPFIRVGSDYAGQLTGFDPHGSDLRSLATVYAPFPLTILVGVPWLRHCARRAVASRLWHGLSSGAALPLAYAPFVSLPGDFYEIGAILVSRAAVALGAAGPVERWRSDDLALLVERLFRLGEGGTLDALVVTAAFLLGAALAWGTYGLGGQAERLYRRLRPQPG